MKAVLRAGVLTTALCVSVFAGEWKIDPAHSSAGFGVKHLMVSTVHGSFNKLSGTVLYDPSNPGATKVDVTIDASTVNTRDDDRDKHLKSPDFFDVAKYPTLTFVSKKAIFSDGKVDLIGDLTIHGVTKETTFHVEGPTPPIKDPRGNTRVGASATTRISRKDFGLTWNKTLEAGGVVVGDDVDLELEVELVAAK